jgi:hypothetical protein
MSLARPMSRQLPLSDLTGYKGHLIRTYPEHVRYQVFPKGSLVPIELLSL